MCRRNIPFISCELVGGKNKKSVVNSHGVYFQRPLRNSVTVKNFLTPITLHKRLQPKICLLIIKGLFCIGHPC